MGARRENSCVRLFVSVDLAGSTAFKTHGRKDGQGERVGPAWVETFTSFYVGFPKLFERELDDVKLEKRLRPRLVKIIGDELLLQTEINSSADARKLVRSLARAISDYKKAQLADLPLRLKATAWIAGFPINNHRVPFDGKGMVEDFIGPSIDAGFRIANAATPSKLVVSVDLALLLLAGTDPLELYFEGTESLHGVLDGRPYPIIWHRVATDDGELQDAELKLRGHGADREKLSKYCEAYVASCTATAKDTWLIRPYFASDPVFNVIPPWHLAVMENWKKADALHAAGDDEPAERKGKRSRRPPKQKRVRAPRRQ